MVIEPGSSPEMRRLILRLNDEFQPLMPVNPVAVPSYATADLPPASKWPFAIAFDTTAGALVVSDGSAWI